MHKQNKTTLAIGVIGFQLLLHCVVVVFSKDLHNFGIHLFAWIFDGALVIVCYFLLKNSPIYYPILFVLALFLSLYPMELQNFLIFRPNIFENTFESAWIYFTHYLGFASIVPPSFSLLCLIYIATKKFKKDIKVSKKFLYASLVVLLFSPLSPQPYLYGFADTVRTFVSREHKIPKLTLPDLRYEVPTNRDFLPDVSLLYNHIMVLVLESVQMDEIKSDTMFTLHHNLISFSNYFTSNLDSYTALIAMLTSFQAPYLSYEEPKMYDKINEIFNLTRYVKQKGYATLFASTYFAQPFVPTRNDWDRIIDANELESKGFLQVGYNKMEKALEDKACIDTLVAFVKEHPKSFIVHEMSYGHNDEWKKHTNKSTLEYTQEYLKQVMAQLKNENLLDKTLFVIVSDHGNRAKSSDVKSYHIPLYLYATNLKAKNIDTMYTHQDLAKIITSVASDTTLPPSRDETLVIGSTFKYIYGTINNQGESLFIDNTKAKVVSSNGNLNPLEVQTKMQNLLDRFGRYND